MITDRIGLHSVLLPLLIIIIITQHFIKNLHTRAEGKKAITKATKEIVKKKQYKNDKIIITKYIIIKLKHEKK